MVRGTTRRQGIRGASVRAPDCPMALSARFVRPHDSLGEDFACNCSMCLSANRFDEAVASAKARGQAVNARYTTGPCSQISRLCYRIACFPQTHTHTHTLTHSRSPHAMHTTHFSSGAGSEDGDGDDGGSPRWGAELAHDPKIDFEVCIVGCRWHCELVVI